MITRVGQISGEFLNRRNLISEIKSVIGVQNVHIVKLGIQTNFKNKLSLNGQSFTIGRTGKLEFDNIDILVDSLIIYSNKEDDNLIPVIIDFVYVINE